MKSVYIFFYPTEEKIMDSFEDRIIEEEIFRNLLKSENPIMRQKEQHRVYNYSKMLTANS